MKYLYKRWMGVAALLTTAVLIVSFAGKKQPSVKKLRQLYGSGDVSKWPAPQLHDSARPYFQEIGHLPAVPHPADNPPSAAKTELGKILFFDPRLSGSGQIACASCHDPQLGWGDGKRVAFGHDRQLGKRNAMTLLNTAYYQRLFWDGRASSLEDQAQRPVMDQLEMHENLDVMEKRVQQYQGYKPLFEKAFGDDSINLQRIFKAIASFERTVVSPPSRFDLFIDGKQEAMTDQEVLGLHLFRTKAGCINCHNGGLFADNRFHNDGQTLFATANEDLGLYNVTKNPSDVGKFKTPSLREVVHTGPWMHHGNFPTLKDVLLFYNLGNPAPLPRSYKGNRDSLLPVTSPMLRKLELTNSEIDALLAFLGAISTTPRRLQPLTSFPK
jgi:cytochrome c peroxidase